MKINIEEDVIKEIFFERYNINLEKIPEGNTKRPDFLAYKNQELIFIAELKTLFSDSHFPTQEELIGIVEYEKGKDSKYSKMADRCKTASDQLQNYKSDAPKIIILLNRTSAYTIHDLRECLHGFTVTKSIDDESRKRKLIIPQYGSIKKVKSCIDMIIWVNKIENEEHIFTFSLEKNAIVGEYLKDNYNHYFTAISEKGVYLYNSYFKDF